MMRERSWPAQGKRNRNATEARQFWSNRMLTIDPDERIPKLLSSIEQTSNGGKNLFPMDFQLRISCAHTALEIAEKAGMELTQETKEACIKEGLTSEQMRILADFARGGPTLQETAEKIFRKDPKKEN